MIINLDDTISSRDNVRREINQDHYEDEKKYVELNLSGNKDSHNNFKTVLIIKPNISTKCLRYLVIVSII